VCELYNVSSTSKLYVIIIIIICFEIQAKIMGTRVKLW